MLLRFKLFFGFGARLLAELGNPFRVISEAADSLGELIHVAGVKVQAVFIMVDELGDPTHSRPDHRFAMRFLLVIVAACR